MFSLTSTSRKSYQAIYNYGCSQQHHKIGLFTVTLWNRDLYSKTSTTRDVYYNILNEGYPHTVTPKTRPINASQIYPSSVHYSIKIIAFTSHPDELGSSLLVSIINLSDLSGSRLVVLFNHVYLLEYSLVYHNWSFFFKCF